MLEQFLKAGPMFLLHVGAKKATSTFQFKECLKISLLFKMSSSVT